jgi:pimeloyl-ACP methyl ester carboxylesterase
VTRSRAGSTSFRLLAARLDRVLTDPAARPPPPLPPAVPAPARRRPPSPAVTRRPRRPIAEADANPETPEGKALLIAASPLTHAADIRRPLLIGQGANDSRVKQAESEQIVAAMKAHHLPVTYIVFPDEGHGFARPENNIAFFGAAEAFLSVHLGGSYLPLTKAEIEASSMQVKDGRDGVPGP